MNVCIFTKTTCNATLNNAFRLSPIWLKQTLISVFVLCGFVAISNKAHAQCENLFAVTSAATRADGKTTFVFTVKNVGAPNALSHFGIAYQFCAGQGANFLTGAVTSYSTNGGLSYNILSTSPQFAVDPSQDCYTSPVLKFDFGTGDIGSTTLYKLEVIGNWYGGFTQVTFKYGNKCCSQAFPGQRLCLRIPGPPVLVCPASTINLGCNEALPAPTPNDIEVSSDCPEGTPVVTFISDVLISTVNCLETYTRTYKATDGCGGFAFCTQTITRKFDRVKPVITLTGPSGANVALGICNPTPELIAAAFGTATVTDVCSLGLEASVSTGDEQGGTSCNRSLTRTWTAEDACGNTASISRTISFTRDLVKPIVTNNPPSAITALCTATFANLPFVAPVFSDNCGLVTLLSVVTTPNAQQETCNAVYSRTWTVRDNCGNTAVFTQNITVPCCEGCSPGFWKNHSELWNALADYPVTQMPAGKKFMTTTNFNLYFNLPSGTNGFANNLTMHGAISQGGGGCKALSRHAVAALLSSASGLNVAYPTGTSNFMELYTAIRSALLSGNCSGTLFTQLEAISESDHRNCGNFETLITVNQAMNPEPEIAVAASPNPYTDRILFTVSSEVAGMASVELYTLLGQKVADLYKGPIQKGEVKTLTYYPTTNNRKTLVYRMVVAGKVVTGKVIYLN